MFMSKIQSLFLSRGLIALLTAIISAPAQAWAVPILDTELASFAVLGDESVTNIPTSTVSGNVGVYDGVSITGFNTSPGVAVSDPQVTDGLVHTTTALAAEGQSQLTIAITSLGSLGPGTLLSADLAGLTIFPGVYTVPAGTSNLTGTVTLDGQGDANAFWTFQLPSTLITSPGSIVNVINTGAGAGLFWNVGSSATLDTTTFFNGNILAVASITLNNGAIINCGRALADNGSVSMDMNTVNSQSCTGILAGSDGLNSGAQAVPEPSAVLFLALGLIGVALVVRGRNVVGSSVE